MRAILDGVIHTATEQGTIEGDILFDEEKIIDVGADISIPDEAKTLDIGGGHVTPGLIDAHSHVGVAEWGEPEDNDVDESTNPVTPHVNAVDGFNPRDYGLKLARQAGITTVSTRMGSANVIGGVISSMKTAGTTVESMRLDEEGMKAALGENPKRIHGTEQGREPSTRPGIAAVLRREFTRAEDYRDRRLSADDREVPFERDLGLENLVRVLEGELALRVHAHRADDILTAFRIADEFGIDRLSIEHATEGHLIAEEFASRNVPAIVGPGLVTARKYELSNITFETAARLDEAGVKVALQTDAPVTPQHYLDISAGLAIRGGLDPEAALHAVTRNPAEILGIDDRVGTLSSGTDADLVVWDGPFYEATTCSQHVFIDGTRING
ncbi:amidohydrolase family protein [Natrialbaceae archaeon A-CW2]